MRKAYAIRFWKEFFRGKFLRNMSFAQTSNKGVLHIQQNLRITATFSVHELLKVIAQCTCTHAVSLYAWNYAVTVRIGLGQ